MEYLCAIDPGGASSGAMAFYLPGTTYPIEVEPLPFKGKELDVKTLAKRLENVTYVLLEKPFAMPGRSNGTLTQFSTYGEIKAVVKLYCPYDEVMASKWKSKMKLTKKDKSESVKLAEKYFPEINLKRTARCKIKDHNLAEAALLVAYALEHLIE